MEKSWKNQTIQIWYLLPLYPSSCLPGFWANAIFVDLTLSLDNSISSSWLMSFSLNIWVWRMELSYHFNYSSILPSEPSHKSLKLILVSSKEKGSAEKDGVRMQMFRDPGRRVWKLHVSPAPTYLVNRLRRFHISHCWWLKVSSFDICRGDMTTKNMERETCPCSFPVFRNIFGNRGGREGEEKC